MSSFAATALHLPVDRLGAEAQDLPPAERRAAEVLLARFASLDHETTASIAADAGVDPATVVRTSRRLGFAGFDDLKLAAARATGTAARAAEQADEVEADDEGSLIRRSMLGDASHIAAAAEAVDTATLSAIASGITTAETVLFTAIGSSAALLGLAAFRFLALGVRVGWYPDSQAQLNAAGLLDQRGLVLALSRSGKSRSVIAVARAGRERGATVALITSAPRSPLASLADHVVVITPDARPDGERYVSRTVHLAVLNAIEALAYRQQRTTAPEARTPRRTRRQR